MTLFKLILLVALVVSLIVVGLAFVVGERRRARPGVRFLPSIGEGLRLAELEPQGARVLVLFLGDDSVSERLTPDALGSGALSGQLEDPRLRSVLLQAGPHDPEVLDHLHEKYAQQPRPAGGPSCLLLDRAGEVLAHGQPKGTDPQGWLAAWLEAHPIGSGPSLSDESC